VAVLKEEYAQYQVDGAATTGGVTVTSSASVPKAPSSPKKLEIVLIGLAVGLMVGLGAAFTAENLDDAIRSRDDLEHVTPDVLVMGLVPMIGSWRDRAEPFLVMRAEPTAPAAEAYRSLRTSLQFAAYDNQITSVLVTSPTATEGKTSTVANLGVVLATVGQHVALANALFAVISLAAAGAIAWWSSRPSARHERGLSAALGLILAGTLGNLFDRLVFGGVRDFMHLHYQSFDWPVFNLADCCLVCGAFLLLAQAFFGKSAAESPATPTRKEMAEVR